MRGSEGNHSHAFSACGRCSDDENLMEEGDVGTNLQNINKSKNNNVLIESPVRKIGILDDSMSSGSGKGQMILQKIGP